MILVAVHVESVIEGEFLACFDGGEGVDEDPLSLDPRLAIRLAGVIDEAGGVPGHVAIDVQLAREREDVDRGIPALLGFRVLRPSTALALFLIDEFADVLDELRPGGNVLRGVNAAGVDR